jgi:hypothetical protein
LFEAAAVELAKPAPTGSRQAVSLARSLSLARALLNDRGGDRAAAGAAYEGTSAALAGGLDDAAASAEFAAANWVAWVDAWSRSTPSDKAESLARAGDVRRKVIDLLASSEWLLGRLGDTGDRSSALGRAFAGARSAADALPAEWKDAAAARTAGANLVKALSAVRRAVTPLVASAGGPDLRGGPDGGEAWRSEVAAAHERTALLWRFAEQAAVMGLARGWKDEDGAARDAYAWAALVYRLERSSLAGAGGVSMRRGGEQTVGDPTMEYLRAELEKARQRSKGLLEYAAPSREYLDLVGDYLKY